MLLYKQIIESRSACKDPPDRKTRKTKNKKIDLEVIEEAANRFAELLISQIEFNKNKTKNKNLNENKNIKNKYKHGKQEEKRQKLF